MSADASIWYRREGGRADQGGMEEGLDRAFAVNRSRCSGIYS